MTEEYDYMDAKACLQAATQGFDEHSEVEDVIWNNCGWAAQFWSGIFGKKINTSEAALGIAALERIYFNENPENKHHAINALMYTATAIKLKGLDHHLLVEKIREEEAEEAEYQKSQQPRSKFSITWEEAKKAASSLERGVRK